MLEAHVVSACPAMEQPVSEGFETYCGLLRLYDGFAVEEVGSVPAFEYDHDHPGLDELRDRYRLDDVGKESGRRASMSGRRGAILMAWREKWARRLGWWNDAWAGYIERRERRMAGGVITSSIGSFAAAPAG